jgi:hypothetical protein
VASADREERPGAARAGASERTDNPAATLVGNVLVGAGAHVDRAAMIAAFRRLEQR